MTAGITNIHARNGARRKAALETKLKELRSPLNQRDELKIEYLADPVDQLKSNSEREMAIQRLGQQTQLVREIRAALVRITDGTYGACEQCDEPIPVKRLDAVPWARLCVPCQTAAEAEGHDGNSAFDDAA